MRKPEQRKLSDKAQATQQELARSHAGAKGKAKGVAVPKRQGQGIGAFASKYQPQPFKSEDDKWREWVRVLRSWSGRFFFCGALAENAENRLRDTATIQQPSWTWRSRL